MILRMNKNKTCVFLEVYSTVEQATELKIMGGASHRATNGGGGRWGRRGSDTTQAWGVRVRCSVEGGRCADLHAERVLDD